jgi:hypothetical protein
MTFSSSTCSSTLGTLNLYTAVVEGRGGGDKSTKLAGYKNDKRPTERGMQWTTGPTIGNRHMAPLNEH